MLTITARKNDVSLKTAHNVVFVPKGAHFYPTLKSAKFPIRKSRKMFDISMAEYGSNEEAIIGKARAYKRMGHHNTAYDLYEHFLRYFGAVSQYTKDVRYAYKRQAYRSGLDSFRRGKYSAAISFFRRVIRNFPYDRLAENALYWIGDSHFSLKKFKLNKHLKYCYLITYCPFMINPADIWQFQRNAIYSKEVYNQCSVLSPFQGIRLSSQSIEP